MEEKKFKSNNFLSFLLMVPSRPLTSSNNTQHCKKWPVLHCRRKEFRYLKYLLLFTLFGFQTQRHLICTYLDNQHDLKQGNQLISSKHRLLQNHRNSTNVSKGTKAKFGNSPETTEKKPKQLLPRHSDPGKNSPELLLCHHPWCLTYPRCFPSHCHCSPGAGERCLSPQPRCAHGSRTGSPSFLLLPSPASPCDLHCLLTPCMLVQLELLLLIVPRQHPRLQSETRRVSEDLETLNRLTSVKSQHDYGKKCWQKVLLNVTRTGTHTYNSGFIT